MTLKDSATKRRILDSAKEVFLEKGYDGARMLDIANKADINKSMLNYYFRYKKNLFEEIFEDIFLKFVPEISAILIPYTPLSYKISKFVDSYFDMLIENPGVPNFVLNELNKNPKRIIKIMKKHGVNPKMFIDELNKELQNNAIDPVNVITLIINTLSLCIFPFVGKPIINTLFFNNDTSKYQIFLNERKKEITTLIINSIHQQ